METKFYPRTIINTDHFLRISVDKKKKKDKPQAVLKQIKVTTNQILIHLF